MHPLVALLIVLFFVGLFAAGTVGGAISTNFRVSADLRNRNLKERIVAEKFGLDLNAIRLGREEYLKTCTACHGPRGEAKPRLGKDLRISKFIAEKSDSQLVMFLKLGRNTWEPDNTTGVAMPPKGGNPMITDQDLGNIAQYIRFLQKDHQESATQ
jgi:disulfide bond formation protein DsbB